MVNGAKRLKRPTVRDNSPAGVAFDVANYIALALLAALTLYPFLRVLAVSFSAPYALDARPFAIIPRGLTLNAYALMLRNELVISSFLNSVFVTVVGSVLDVTVSAMLAYAISKRTLPLRNLFTLLFVFTMFFNAGLIPTFLNIRRLGLMDTRAALILPRLVNTYFMLICRNFFMNVSPEIEESARIDGANDFTIFLRLIVPVSKPVLLTLLLWYGVFRWNNYFDALIYITSTDKRVLQTVLRAMIRYGAQDGAQSLTQNELSSTGVDSIAIIRSSVIVVSVVPILIVYPFIQKHFVKGIMIGSLKG